MISAFFTAAEVQDGTVIHGLLISDFRKRCTPEQLENSFGGDVIPEFAVSSVFVDLEEPNKAMIQIVQQRALGAGVAGSPSASIISFSWPMERENGQWRLGFPSFVAGEGCPFGEGSSETSSASASPRRVDATPEPPLPRLAPPPGLRPIISRSGGNGGESTASVLLSTDMTLADLMEHYRQQVLQPDWEVQQETMADDLSVLTWTFRDESNHPWFGILMITPAEGDLRWVRLWMGGGLGDAPRMIPPEGREPPAPSR